MESQKLVVFASVEHDHRPGRACSHPQCVEANREEKEKQRRKKAKAPRHFFGQEDSSATQKEPDYSSDNPPTISKCVHGVYYPDGIVGINFGVFNSKCWCCVQFHYDDRGGHAWRKLSPAQQQTQITREKQVEADYQRVLISSKDSTLTVNSEFLQSEGRAFDGITPATAAEPSEDSAPSFHTKSAEESAVSNIVGEVVGFGPKEDQRGYIGNLRRPMDAPRSTRKMPEWMPNREQFFKTMRPTQATVARKICDAWVSGQTDSEISREVREGHRKLSPQQVEDRRSHIFRQGDIFFARRGSTSSKSYNLMKTGT